MLKLGFLLGLGILFSCNLNKSSKTIERHSQEKHLASDNKSDHLKSKKDSLVELIIGQFSGNDNSYHFFRDNYQYSLITNSSKDNVKKIVFFDSLENKISNVYNVSEKNPYRKYINQPQSHSNLYQQSGYFIPLVNDEAAERIPASLNAITPKNYKAANALYSNHLFQISNTGLIINYQFELLPEEEVLENISIPGVSILSLVNENGEPIRITQEFPYKILDARFTMDKNHLFLTHQDSYQKYKEIDWPISSENCITIYSLTNEAIAYQKCDLGIVFVENSTNDVTYFQSHQKELNSKNEITHYIFNPLTKVLNIVVTDKSWPSGSFDYSHSMFAIKNGEKILKSISFNNPSVKKIPLTK